MTIEAHNHFCLFPMSSFAGLKMNPPISSMIFHKLIDYYQENFMKIVTCKRPASLNYVLVQYSKSMVDLSNYSIQL